MYKLLFILLFAAQSSFAANCRNFDTEVKALSCNIYFEARGQSLVGKMLVGFVTINRSKHEDFPSNIKSIVKQPQQFSWRKRKSLVILEKSSWESSTSVAKLMLRMSKNEALYRKLDFTKGGLWFYKQGTPKPRLNIATRVSFTDGAHNVLIPK